jgi:hypothetical protein
VVKLRQPFKAKGTGNTRRDAIGGFFRLLSASFGFLRVLVVFSGLAALVGLTWHP